MPRYAVALEELCTYTVIVDADDEDAASDMAEQVFLDSANVSAFQSDVASRETTHVQITEPDDELSTENPRYKASLATKAEMLAALKLIRDARDHHAETGAYPAGLLGEDQEFDDWSADVASAAITKAEGRS